MEKIVIPAINERIKTLHAMEQTKFESSHRIIQEFPNGSKVMIKNVT